MLPTRTTVLLLTVGLHALAGRTCRAVAGGRSAVVVGASRRLRHFWIVLGYDGCVVLLFLADAAYAWRATRFGRLSVRRERPARLSLGVDNEIVLVLENHSAVR